MPAQAAQYPPTKPVRCGAGVDGNRIVVKIRPLRDTGYRFEIQKRKSKGDWKIADTGRTRASDGLRSVKVSPGRYRVKCYGGPNRLDGITSSRRVD